MSFIKKEKENVWGKTWLVSWTKQSMTHFVKPWTARIQCIGFHLTIWQLQHKYYFFINLGTSRRAWGARYATCRFINTVNLSKTLKLGPAGEQGVPGADGAEGKGNRTLDLFWHFSCTVTCMCANLLLKLLKLPFLFLI